MIDNRPTLYVGETGFRISSFSTPYPLYASLH